MVMLEEPRISKMTFQQLKPILEALIAFYFVFEFGLFYVRTM